MKFQQPSPFKTINAEDILTHIGKDYFCLSAQNLINSDCTISTGRTYILIFNRSDIGLQAIHVRLDEAFYINVQMHIILKDLISKRRIRIMHNTQKQSKECTWKLVDWEHYVKKVEDAVIKSYCGCD